MNTEKTIWELPCNSTELLDSPTIEHVRDSFRIKFEYETDDGVSKVEMVFNRLISFKFTFYLSCDPKYIRAYDKLLAVTNSTMLKKIQENNNSYYNKLNHYRIFFDDFGGLDIVAEDFEIVYQ